MPADVEDANRDERHLFSGDIVAHTVESIVALDTEWRLRTLYFTTLPYLRCGDRGHIHCQGGRFRDGRRVNPSTDR